MRFWGQRGGQVPNLDGLARRCGGRSRRSAIGREADADNDPVVGRELPDRLSGVGIPERHDPFPARDGEVGAIGRVSERRAQLAEGCKDGHDRLAVGRKDGEHGRECFTCDALAHRSYMGRASRRSRRTTTAGWLQERETITEHNQDIEFIPPITTIVV